MNIPYNKVYISGPITGVEGSYRNFREAKKFLENMSHIVLDPTGIKEPAQTTDLWVYYMKKSIILLMEAESIYFLNGWEASRGCRLEFLLATQLSIPMFFERDKDNV